jgi:hypothetical protein
MFLGTEGRVLREERGGLRRFRLWEDDGGRDRERGRDGEGLKPRVRGRGYAYGGG